MREVFMANKEKITIKLNNLKFDAQNPRLPMRLQGVTDENKVIDYMVKYGNVTELMLSIGETGYSEAEPLLVVKEGTDKYIVVEGNRRLAALKLLNDSELTKVRIQSINSVVSGAKYIPEEVPCIVYASREDVLDYLGYRHITGVKDWGALEKARYLDQLYQIHIKSTPQEKIYQKLAKMIGSRSDYVYKLHTALKLYNKANDKAYYGADIKEEDISFSWLTTALGYYGISKYLGISESNEPSLDTLNEENYKKIFTWMFFPGKSVVKESRQISDLAKITEYPLALERLEKGSSIEEALLYTSEPSDAFIDIPVALAQCTCSYDEWINKQESINSDTWRTRIDPIAPFWRYMYVPFYCHNASGKFEQLTDIHTCLIDRQRILCLLDLHHELFEQLESLQLQVLINNIW